MRWEDVCRVTPALDEQPAYFWIHLVVGDGEPWVNKTFTRPYSKVVITALGEEMLVELPCGSWKEVGRDKT